MKEFISKHKQSFKSIFAFTVFLVYSWSVIIILWDLPALLLRFGINNIIGYVAYQFLFSLVESILVFLLVVAVCLFIPLKSVRENPAVAGCLLVLSLGIGATVLRFLPNLVQKLFPHFSQFNPSLILLIAYGLWLYLFIVIVVFSLRIARNERISYYVLTFSDRLLPLVSIYVILSVCSVFVVLLRNIAKA